MDSPGATLVVIGEIGAGKTTAAFHALGPHEESGDRIIWIQHPDRAHLGIGTIMSAMVRTLKEAVRRDIDARTEQLRKLLGTATREHRVCVVIDDAQELPTRTLRALKLLLELHFAQRKSLFSLLLVGTPELESRLQMVPQQFWRCRFVDLKLLSQTEAKALALWVADWGNVPIDAAAAEAIGKRYQNPLVIASVVAGVQDMAERAAEKRVTAAVTRTYLNAALRRQVERAGISQGDLAKELGWSPAKVSKVVTGNYPGDRSSELVAGLARIRNGSTAKAGAR